MVILPAFVASWGGLVLLCLPYLPLALPVGGLMVLVILLLVLEVL